MAERITNADAGLVQEALELRHAVEAMAEQCQRLYERTNALVERTRRLAAPPDGGPGADPPPLSAPPSRDVMAGPCHRSALRRS